MAIGFESENTDIHNEVADIGDPIDVLPSDLIFKELGNNTYDYRDLLSELIDNSIAAREPDSLLHIIIKIGVSQSDQYSNWLSIRDDASGISREELGTAISPAGKQTSSALNEQLMGES